MESIGAALGNQRDLRTRGPSRIRIAIRGRDAELLGRIQGGTQHAVKRKAIHLVVVVNAVQSDVALIGAGAGNCALAAVGIAPGILVAHARLFRPGTRRRAAG